MQSFPLQIVTPDGMFYEGPAEKVRVRTIAGDVCILARHIDYATALGMGEARVTIEGKVRRAACIGGMLAVTKGSARLVATTFEWAEDIDVSRAEEARRRAEEKLAGRKTLDEQETALAEAKLKRALVRLGVSQ